MRSPLKPELPSGLWTPGSCRARRVAPVFGADRQVVLAIANEQYAENLGPRRAYSGLERWEDESCFVAVEKDVAYPHKIRRSLRAHHIRHVNPSRPSRAISILLRSLTRSLFPFLI